MQQASLTRLVRNVLMRTVLSAAAIFLLASNALAQTGGTGTGGTGTGGTGTGGTSTGTGTTGGTSGGVTVGGQGAGGGLSGPALLSFGADIDTTGGTGFAGRGSAAENFVGGIVQPGTGAGGNARGGNNQFSAINRQGQVNRGTQPTGPSRSERLRPRHRVAFAYTPSNNAVLSVTLQTRLGALPSPIDGVEVQLDDQGTATLRGTAATSHAASLAAALARLEPGVRRVDNQLVVAGNP